MGEFKKYIATNEEECIYNFTEGDSPSEALSEWFKEYWEEGCYNPKVYTIRQGESLHYELARKIIHIDCIHDDVSEVLSDKMDTQTTNDLEEHLFKTAEKWMKDNEFMKGHFEVDREVKLEDDHFKRILNEVFGA